VTEVQVSGTYGGNGFDGRHEGEARETVREECPLEAAAAAEERPAMVVRRVTKWWLIAASAASRVKVRDGGSGTDERQGGCSTVHVHALITASAAAVMTDWFVWANLPDLRWRKERCVCVDVTVTRVTSMCMVLVSSHAKRTKRKTTSLLNMSDRQAVCAWVWCGWRV
jgi:hypothetical protein